MDEAQGLTHAILELVRGVQTCASRPSDQCGGYRIHAATHRPRPTHDPAERLTFEVLHGHEELPALLAEVENLDDVRMADVGNDASLVEKHLGEGPRAQMPENSFD